MNICIEKMCKLRSLENGLRAVNLEAFKSRLNEYGAFSHSYCDEIYAAVTTSANGKSGGGEVFVRDTAEPAVPEEAEPEAGFRRPVFQAPAPRGRSVLGLDVLAARKREEAAAQQPRVASMALAGDEPAAEEAEAGGGAVAERAGGSREGKSFRSARVETPSHAGGVSETALEAMADRGSRRPERGVYVSTRAGEEPGRASRPSARGNGERGNAERGGEALRGSGGSSATWRDGPRDEWEDTPTRGHDSRSSTPLRDTPSRGRGAWDSGASAPTARSGGAGPPSGSRGSVRGSWQPSSARGGGAPRFDIDATPGGGAAAWRSMGDAPGGKPQRGGAGDQPLSAAELAEREAMQEAEAKRADADWYDEDEAGGHGETFNPFAGGDESYKAREAEVQKRLTRRDGSLMTLAQSKKNSQLHADHTAWEENRLMTSGVVRLREVDTEFDDSEEARISLLVHDSRPPFLDGRVVFTKQTEPVLPVKDVSSDLAKIARAGSALVREMRTKRDGDKARERFWDLGGTAMGNIIGVKKVETEADGDDQAARVKADGEVDYKESAGFAKHMEAANVAVSEFAKNKTLLEQRRFLPVYGCREDLMDVIRENNIVVVVGETGSGKTTQLTQVGARAMPDAFFGIIVLTARVLLAVHDGGGLLPARRHRLHAAAPRRGNERREAGVRGGGLQAGRQGWLRHPV